MIDYTTSGYETYVMYCALKAHFTTEKYDFFLYNGKMKLSKDSFLRNKSKYSFYKLSRKYRLDEARDFFVSNFIKGGVKWVGEIVSEEADGNYKDWKRVQESLSYVFENDLDHLLEDHSPVDLIAVKNGDYPVLYTKQMRGEVHLETIVIMNAAMGFMPMWSKKVNDDIVFPAWSRMVRKYTPFMTFDLDKFKAIMKEKFSSVLNAA